ncbi:uncharacterized protein LOC119832968 [Zerene cesonia]|uniref:uncharacterized protein LOC119832968 n=1 Tax=Zerene cesonia TaxID=33412 RepID=UPI0018E523DA|nr:uncharacterized protein LOC119832968 [Zerene cesonia]
MTMCSNGSNFSMKLETGCLIWAICGMIISGTAGVYSFVLIFSIGYCEPSETDDGLGHAIGEVLIAILIFFSCLIVISFLFSVVLLVGVIKKRESFLTTYVIFGVVISTFLLSVFFILLLIVAHDNTNALGSFLLHSLIFFLLLGLYSLILLMVQRTSRKFRDESFSTTNQRNSV